MNCLKFRRLLLADPRARTGEQERHLAECAACAGLAREMERFEASIHDALRVPVPEALDEKVLLRRRMHGPSVTGWALAASLAALIAVGSLLYHALERPAEPIFPAAALGGAHPAVAAITYVVEHESRLLREGRRGDPAVLRSALNKLGLRLPDGASVEYLGECPVPGGTGEHVVLRTAEAQVTLILVPDRSLGTRVIVADRAKVAVSAPHGGGSYILIADSLREARRTEGLLM